jgi:hypothetical protein
VVLRYQRSLIAKTIFHGIKDRLRSLLGLRPLLVLISTDLAYLTDSYHLKVLGPEDQYVSYQRLECPYCNERIDRSWKRALADSLVSDELVNKCDHNASPTGSRDYHFRVRQRLGQDYSHLYARGWAKHAPRNLQFLVRFEEKPPGTLIQAALSATLVAILTVCIGIIVTNADPGIESDTPALILGAPGIIVSAVGFAGSSDAVLRSALATRMSLLFSSLLSVIAASMFLLNRSGVFPYNSINVHFYGVTSLEWDAVAILAIIHCALILRTLSVRVRSYRKLIERNSRYGRHSVAWTNPRSQR